MLAVQFDFLIHTGFWLDVGVSTAIFGLFALGMQLNVGTTGIANLGQVGFMAIGSYTAVLLVLKGELSWWVAAPAGIAAATVAGVLLGALSLRLDFHYFAIGTLAFAESIRLIVNTQNSLTGGSIGLYGYTNAWSQLSSWVDGRLAAVGIGHTFLLPLLLLSWLLFLLLMLVVWWLSRTPWGRVLKAIRADEHCTRALGKRTTLYKIQSLAIAAALAAIAGYLRAIDTSVLTPDSFDATPTIYGVMIIIVGGVGSYAGVMFGSLLLFVILEGTRYMELPLADTRVAALRYMVVGALLILMIALRPQGILGKREELRLK